MASPIQARVGLRVEGMILQPELIRWRPDHFT
jgi:hypothetical protein